MRWIGLIILVGAVVMAALPVIAADQDAENSLRHQEWLRNAEQCQAIVDDMAAKGMQADWFLQGCLRKDRSI